MAVEATSDLALVVEAMVHTLSNTPTWAIWADGSSPSNRQFIHIVDITETEFYGSDTTQRPRVLITQEDWDSPTAGAGSGTVIPRGTFRLRFFFPYDEEETLTDQVTTMRNNVGDVLADLVALSQGSSGDYLYITGTRIVGQSRFPAETEKDTMQHIICEALVDWGLEGVGA